jgi:hypothetical protein
VHVADPDDRVTAPQPVIVVPALVKLTLPVGVAVDGDAAVMVAVRSDDVP